VSHFATPPAIHTKALPWFKPCCKCFSCLLRICPTNKNKAKR
jgi:hypothetical protein